MTSEVTTTVSDGIRRYDLGDICIDDQVCIFVKIRSFSSEEGVITYLSLHQTLDWPSHELWLRV